MKKKFRCVFLILHFKDAELTKSSVDTLKKINGIEECKILIVDNGSINNSGEFLQETYAKDKIVEVLLLKENGGFSKGNNHGYRYAKQNFSFDFIVAMNNDVYIYQKNFIDKIYQLYDSDKFNVAGPDIYVPQNSWHSSPLRKSLMTEKEFRNYYNEWVVKKQIMQNRMGIKPFVKYCESRMTETLLYKELYKMNRKVRGQKYDWYRSRVYNCVLQGACIIFDYKFVQENNSLFFPETFLYSEEDILTFRCIEHGYKIAYYPELQVYHTCHGSTNKKKESYGEFCNKKCVEYQRVIDALKIFANEQGFVVK